MDILSFITGIIFILIGVYLLNLLKQGKNKIIVQGIERIAINKFGSYIIILIGLFQMVISIVPDLIPDFPYWGTIPITIAWVLIIVIIFRNKIKK